MFVSIAFLSVVGASSALLLYFVAKKFHVEEDPRIADVNEALPGANCGGCGFPGCAGFAKACVDADTLDGLFCTVGGNDTMLKVADILGRTAVTAEPQIAVVRCNGTCEARPKTNTFDGATSCAVAASLYGGETDCSYGCLGMGDCTLVCDFDAIHMNPETGLPEVDQDKCTACGACVKACPKMIIELRRKGPRNMRIFVSCVNKDKGAVAKRACANACIGCSLCLKECKFDAITINDQLSYIDSTKCRLCRKCVPVCPTNAIHELNFPPRKEKKEVQTEKVD
ncbi:MAG: Fe-S cluster domain-containing protein [Porphyromonas sp.]|nr:Fe-S cluster domain-containing protein [Porphyromonas sp.]